jgi:hypothetical protein
MTRVARAKARRLGTGAAVADGPRDGGWGYGQHAAGKEDRASPREKTGRGGRR